MASEARKVSERRRMIIVDGFALGAGGGMRDDGQLLAIPPMKFQQTYPQIAESWRGKIL